MGKKWKQWQILFSWAPKSLWMVTVVMKLKDACFLEPRRQWQPIPVLLPRKPHGRRSLVGCSHGVTTSWAWLSDFTFTFHFPALEKEMATHSSVLAWRIPQTEEPGGLLSVGSHRVGHNWSDLAAAAAAPWKKSSNKPSCCCCSVAHSYPTIFDPMDYSTTNLDRILKTEISVCKQRCI